MTLWGHILGAHAEIEPKWLIMALLISKHMTVQGKKPYRTYINALREALDQIYLLMKKLSTIKGAARLAKPSPLAAVQRNDTRWSSSFEMLRRFFELESVLDRNDPELVVLCLQFLKWKVFEVSWWIGTF